MKSVSLILCLLPALILCATTTVTTAADEKSSDAFRNEYIKHFKRIGLNTTPGDAMMLRILVESADLKRGVEVGTATGFGALNMGMAFERTGGHLYTLDIDPEMVRKANGHIRKVGLEKTITVIEADALKELPKLEGEYDFLFIDAVKQDYMKYFKAMEPKLKPGSVIVADNVIRFGDQMRDYLDYVQNSPNYDTVIIRASMEKGDGMAISYKLR